MSSLPATTSKQAVTQAKTEKEMEFVPFGAADKIKLSIKIVQTMIAVKTRSGATCSDADAIKFMMLCEAQRLNPFAGDAYLTGYDGKDGAPAKFSLITAHVAFLKRAEASPDFQGMESGVIILSGSEVDEKGVRSGGELVEREGDFYLPEEIVVGGWAKVFRKDRKPTYRRLAVEQRKPNYSTPFWDPPKHAEQIVKCAEADALRSTFPSLLGGLHAPGEIYEVVTVKSEPLRINEGAGDMKRLEAATKVVEEPAGAVSLQQQVEDFLTANEISFDDFKGWLVATGGITAEGADVLADCHGLPAELCGELLSGGARTLKLCGKIYAAKK